MNADELARFERAVASRMTEGTVLIRASDGQILYTNASWDRMVGYVRGELEGRQISEVTVPGDGPPEARFREVQAALRRTGVWRGMVCHVRKNRSRFWCDTSVTTYEDPRHGTLWLLVQRDVTKRMAEERRPLAGMRRVNGVADRDRFHTTG